MMYIHQPESAGGTLVQWTIRDLFIHAEGIFETPVGLDPETHDHNRNYPKFSNRSTLPMEARSYFFRKCDQYKHAPILRLSTCASIGEFKASHYSACFPEQNPMYENVMYGPSHIGDVNCKCSLRSSLNFWTVILVHCYTCTQLTTYPGLLRIVFSH